MKWAGRGKGESALPPLASGGDGTLPPHFRGGSGALPKLSQGHRPACGSSKDVAVALLSEPSEGALSVTRSPLSGSSKAPFPPDRRFINDFQWTLASRDLPEAVRPIVEDNKMMHEELRRYRQRVGEQEGIISSQERQLVTLRDELLRQKELLQACSVAPAQLLQDQEFRQMIHERDDSIQQLEHKATVLERAKQAAERRLANDLATERRQQAEMKWQLKQLQEEMAAKQKHARFNQLHINQLHRRLKPLEAAMAAAAAPAPALLPLIVEEAPAAKPEERVQLMLCLVYAQPQPTAEEIAEVAARLVDGELERQLVVLHHQREEAACRVQAAFRGYRAQRQLAAQQQAAVRIQAATRGMLVRLRVASLLQQRARAAASSPAPVGRSAAHRQAARRQQRVEQAAQGVASRAKLPQLRLPAGHTLPSPTRMRPANTAPEAAARQRSRHGSAMGPAGAAGAAGLQALSANAAAAGLHAASEKAGAGGSAGGRSPSREGGRSPSRGSARRTGSRLSVNAVAQQQGQGQQGQGQQGQGQADSSGGRGISSPGSVATRRSSHHRLSINDPSAQGRGGTSARRLGFASSQPRISIQ